MDGCSDHRDGPHVLYFQPGKLCHTVTRSDRAVIESGFPQVVGAHARCRTDRPSIDVGERSIAT